MAKRLESLGALTQGDRRASAGNQGLGLSTFNVDTRYGHQALQILMDEARFGGKSGAYGKSLMAVPTAPGTDRERH